MKYTNFDVIKECVMQSGKVCWKLDFMRLILISKFGIISLKYKNLISEYMKMTVMAMELEGLIVFEPESRNVRLNTDNPKVMELVEELSAAKKEDVETC